MKIRDDLSLSEFMPENHVKALDKNHGKARTCDDDL